MPFVYIHADESCLGNGREGSNPGGAAGLVSFWTGEGWERRDYWISERATTNNRMAIRSAVEGLSGLKRASQVIFTSDSEYLVKTMSGWIHAWARQGWKRKSGPVENVELWQMLARAAARHEVEWRWVRGHAGHPQNEYANDLAVQAAKTQTSSSGLVPSGLDAWLEKQRERGRYMDFYEFAPAPSEDFRPASHVALP